MEIIVPDQIIMGLILYAGDAKQHIYKALDYIKNGTCERCEEEIQLADAALLEAHNLQTKFLAQEASGTKTEITALFVHSQDHLISLNKVRRLGTLLVKFGLEAKELSVLSL
ncbi:PTS system sugar-specific transporter subunit EIIA [Streptococcus pneumoniae]|uniref:PTS system sugar-specific transporter subunit EIIA n=1 Tax=Streptococcus pneumoniae TaxID=1313 RepID=A0A4J1RD75_STREE|nr:PTS system sugar-specific transporter subunit EIIA [Streptococcus pneumoniae]VNK41763.1 PTS system sugar-specific transporter subunit EIIA [Streptococcus pneumoniae]VNP05615.1 PTS system sugar-specific transporter subunit EIIA [Streptococcus pneumoniae]